jgi:tetratricopeptide (TPR) repeat protein
MPARIQPCPDDAHLVHIKVHEKNYVPQSLEPVEPGGTQDNYLPPHNSLAIQIRATAQNIGAQGICQKNGSLFAMFANASDVSEQIYGTKIELVDRMRALWDLTMKYMDGEVDVETYIADTEHVAIVDQNAVSKTLIQELQYGSLKPEEDRTQPSRKRPNPHLDLLYAEIELNPNNPYSWADLAKTYFRIGKLSQAIVAAKWLVKIYPEDPRSWEFLANVLDAYHKVAPEERAHVREEAIRARARQEKLNNDFDNMLRLGQSLLDSGIDGHAATALERAVEIRAKHKKGLGKEGGLALGLLGVAYNRLGRDKEAVDALKRSNELYQSDGTWFLTHLSSSLKELGRWAEAEQVLEEAVKLDPDWAPHWESLGITRYHLNKNNKAKAAFRTAMEKDAENTTDAPVWFAKTLLKSYSRRKKKSRKKIQEIWGIVAAIACQYREENYKITELFEGLVKLAPEVPELLVRLGISLFHDGRLGEAKDALITAIDRNAININEALDWLARTAIQSLGKQPERNFKDLQNTYNFLTEAASKHPASGGSDFLGVLGRFAYWLGKQDEAEFFLVGAMQIDPADADHGKLLAALYCDEGRVEEALRVLEQLVAYGVDDNEVKVRILELRAFLAGRNSNNPKGGTNSRDLGHP